MEVPTGYTSPVQNGKITTLRELAMYCARAFGACIDMRDEPMDKPVPDRFEPRTSYYDEKIAEERALIAELSNLSAQECERRAIADHADRLDSHKRYLAEKEQSRQRYQSMSDQVAAWRVPEELSELRAFMLQQLGQSIDFDCSTKYVPSEPAVRSGAAWLAETLAETRRNLAYHEEHRAAEIRHTEERNQWLVLLRASLDMDRS